MKNKNIKIILLFLLIISLVPLSIWGASVLYTIKTGDSLRSIAGKYGITLEQLVDMNPQLIKRGQRINVPVPVPVPKPVPIPMPIPDPIPDPKPVATSTETRIKAYLTAYTYWDNTPPGSADIALPVIHEKAGGMGTYADPITIAVGHVISSGKSTPDYPAGMKFYVPNVRRYFIVEDLCGDGSTPQNGPCHKGYPLGTVAWFDMWIDGATGTKSQTNSCAEAVTGSFLVIKDPAPNYQVVTGPVFQDSTCTEQFGDTVLIN